MPIVEGKADGQWAVGKEPNFTFAFNASINENNFTAIPCNPAKFIKHRFLIWLKLFGVPDGSTVYWMLKNITKNEVVDNGTGKFNAKTIDYTTYSGTDIIRFSVWLSSGNFTACGALIFNHIWYNP
jgi:hypothetical protein